MAKKKGFYTSIIFDNVAFNALISVAIRVWPSPLATIAFVAAETNSPIFSPLLYRGTKIYLVMLRAMYSNTRVFPVTSLLKTDTMSTSFILFFPLYFYGIFTVFSGYSPKVLKLKKGPFILKPLPEQRSVFLQHFSN